MRLFSEINKYLQQKNKKQKTKKRGALLLGLAESLLVITP